MPGTPATPGGTQPATGQTSTPSTQLVPPVQTLLYESSTTTLSSALRLRPWTLTASIGYQLSGGADASAQATLPFQHGPLAEATADLKVAQRDRLVRDTSPLPRRRSRRGPTICSPRQRSNGGTCGRARRRRYVGAGLYEARTRTAENAPFGFNTSPVAEAAIDQHFDRGSNHVEIRLDGRLAPNRQPSDRARRSARPGCARRAMGAPPRVRSVRSVRSPSRCRRARRRRAAS